jgi:lysozyme
MKTAEFKDYPLWIAQYTSAKQPAKMAPWPTWTFWQYTSKGSIPGLKGNFDINRFNGDLTALKALTVKHCC